jgi:hypothetical protein
MLWLGPWNALGIGSVASEMDGGNFGGRKDDDRLSGLGVACEGEEGEGGREGRVQGREMGTVIETTLRNRTLHSTNRPAHTSPPPRPLAIIVTYAIIPRNHTTLRPTLHTDLTQQAFQGSTPKSEATQSTSPSHPKVLVTLLICFDQPWKQWLVNLGNKDMVWGESGSSLACRRGGIGIRCADQHSVRRRSILFETKRSGDWMCTRRAGVVSCSYTQ